MNKLKKNLSHCKLSIAGDKRSDRRERRLPLPLHLAIIPVSTELRPRRAVNNRSISSLLSTGPALNNSYDVKYFPPVQIRPKSCSQRQAEVAARGGGLGELRVARGMGSCGANLEDGDKGEYLECWFTGVATKSVCPTECVGGYCKVVSARLQDLDGRGCSLFLSISVSCTGT